MYLPDLTLHTLSIRKRHKQQKSAFACLAWMHTCTCYVQSAQPQPFTAIMTRYVWLAAPRHCPMQPRGERASVGGTSLEVALTVSFLSQSCSFVVRSGDARDATYATPRFIISTIAIGEECVWRCGGVVVAVLVETWIPCWLGNGAVLALEP